MASRNLSPSYLAERDRVWRWLHGSRAGGRAKQNLIKASRLAGENPSEVFDNDDLVDWETLQQEHRDSVVAVASNAEARNAFELARQSSSIMAAPSPSKAKFRKVFSPESWYYMRRIAQTGDPNYWNDPKNIYREALEWPEWAPLPAEYYRAALEQYLPRGKKVVLAGSTGE